MHRVLFHILLTFATGSLADWYDPAEIGANLYNTWKVQTGFFIHDNPSINENIPDYAKNALGLIQRDYPTDNEFDPLKNRTQWERFEYYVDWLNSKSSLTAKKYKVIYFQRHAEGWHNVAENYYGRKCFQCYWSLQNGNGTVSWDDAELTPKGLQQAENAKKFWINTRNTDKVPFPQFFFVSPLRRTLQTATITFQEHLSKINESMFADPQRRAPGYRVTIPELWAWEALRETVSACTCSKRHRLSWIRREFPKVIIPPFQDMTEEDSFWIQGMNEPVTERLYRAQLTLEAIGWSESVYHSMTAHGSIIRSFLEVLGHPNPKFPMGNAYTLPVFFESSNNENGTAFRKRAQYTDQVPCGVCQPAGASNKLTR